MGTGAEASRWPAGTSAPVLASQRMARRLLSGAGSATLTAYRSHNDGAHAMMVLHALDTQGRILVAALPPEDLCAGGATEGIDVRLDVTLESAEAALRVTTASAHLLGTLHWLSGAQASAILAGRSAACHCPITGEDPLHRLSELVHQEGGRLGIVIAERVIVHDAQGASPHPLTRIAQLGSGDDRALLWSATEEMMAQADVAALGEISLEALCEGVRAGDLAGMLCSSRPATGLCASMAGMVLCVDVAPGAVTLMRVGAAVVETFQVWLPDDVSRAVQVVPYLREMVAEVLVAELLRIS